MLQDVINKVVSRYNTLGYKVGKINYKVVETFSHPDVGDLNPLCINKSNTTIYVDDAAYIDLKNNEKAQMFYIGHEIAHAAANANHENSKFLNAIKQYNKAFPEDKTVAEPNDSYNKKFLPTFYKKDKWLDNATDIEQVKKDFINKVYIKENKGVKLNMINEGATKDFRKQVRKDVYGDIQDYNKKVTKYIKEYNTFVDRFVPDEDKGKYSISKYATEYRNKNGLVDFKEIRDPEAIYRNFYSGNKNDYNFISQCSKLSRMYDELKKLSSKAYSTSKVIDNDDVSRYYDKDFDNKNAEMKLHNKEDEYNNSERRLSQAMSQRIKAGYINKPNVERGEGDINFTGVSYQSVPGEVGRTRDKQESKAERRETQIENTKFKKAYELIDAYIKKNGINVNTYDLGVYSGHWTVDIDYDREGNEKKLETFINKELPLTKADLADKSFISRSKHGGHTIKESIVEEGNIIVSTRFVKPEYLKKFNFKTNQMNGEMTVTTKGGKRYVITGERDDVALTYKMNGKEFDNINDALSTITESYFGY